MEHSAESTNQGDGIQKKWDAKFERGNNRPTGM